MRRTALGAMVGTMVGITLAVGLHTLLTARPELAAGWLGVTLARVSAPGAWLIGHLTGHHGSHEMGILAAWLSLQLTLVLGGAVLGLTIAILVDLRRKIPSSADESG